MLTLVEINKEINNTIESALERAGFKNVPLVA